MACKEKLVGAFGNNEATRARIALIFRLKLKEALKLTPNDVGIFITTPKVD